VARSESEEGVTMTIQEAAKMLEERIAQQREATMCRRDASCSCKECAADRYYDALSDVIDMCPIGMPGSWRGAGASGRR
jgi:hypothetical protein